jgi:hypothetical protein
MHCRKTLTFASSALAIALSFAVSAADAPAKKSGDVLVNPAGHVVKD